MEIRDATHLDLELVCTLRLAFLAEHRSLRPEDLPDDLGPRTLDFLQRHDRAGTIRTWLAEDDAGVCLGLVSMLLLEMAPMPDDPRSHDGYLINMYVEPAARHRGVGRALLDRAIAESRTLGIRRLLLVTTDDGRPLYEAAGFGTDDRWLDLRLER